MTKSISLGNNMAVAPKDIAGTVLLSDTGGDCKTDDVPDSITGLASWVREHLASHRVSTSTVLGTFGAGLLSTDHFVATWSKS